MKLKLCVIVAVTTLLGVVTYMTKRISKLERDNIRLTENYSNVRFHLDSIKGKNDELHFTVNGLVLTKNELEDTNENLVRQLDTMRIKLKNVKTIVKTNIHYQTNFDTVFISKLDSSKTFKTNISNDYLNSSWSSTVQNDTLKVSNYQLSLLDSLTIISETKYKGWWIFKRPRGVKLHIKSENPYSNIDKIEFIELK